LYAVHSLLLALTTALMACHPHLTHLWIPALLTLLLKTVVIPQVFFGMIRRIGIRREVESYINIPFSLILAVLLLFLSFYGTTHLWKLSSVEQKEFIPMAIATVFWGMLMMVTRKKALTQIVGLLLMENGLFLMAVTLTSGMPLLVELGIFFDVLVGVIIMGVFVFKIRDAFEGIDVDDLTVLKG
jgi:hydrogenase-4 component E